MVDEEIPPTELADFIAERGAVELLCEIDPAGSRFDHLVEELEISRATVSKRLQKGEELGLLETIESEGSGSANPYVLTEDGARIRIFLNQRGTTEKYRQIKRLRREFDAHSATLRRWLREDGSETPLFVETVDARRLLRTVPSHE